MTSSPGFTGSPLDRVDHLRENAEAIAAFAGDPEARLLLLDGLDPLLDDSHRLRRTLLADAPTETPLALLGLIDEKPLFVALTAIEPGNRMSMALRDLLGLIPAGEAATYAAARSLVDWHSRHRFCAQCGQPTESERAGWSRRCSGCGTQHFPRTDPVVIMLAEHDGRVLLGRQPIFPAGFFSALAGFIELGESIEDAVIRELYEEAGVRAHSVRYVASQPWPFPSSLMIGAIAKVDGPEINLDTNELEAAIWVTREEVRAALAGEPGAPFATPPSYAIAHTLLAHWVGEG